MAESKVVLITGANTGVGFHICRALYGSNESYSLIVAGRSMSKVLDAIKSLEAEFPTSPNSLTPLLIDLEVDETIFCGYNDFAKKFNKVDALVNNAGIVVSARSLPIIVLMQTHRRTIRQGIQRRTNDRKSDVAENV